MKKFWDCCKCDEWKEEKDLDEIKFFRNSGAGEDYEAICKQCVKEEVNE